MRRSPSFPLPGRSIVGVLLLALLAACSDTVPPPGGPRSLQRDTLSGVPFALPGEVVARPLVVQALDSRGEPVRGAEITWVVTSGGGSVDPVVSTTDAQGRAQTTWRLGSSGSQVVEARAGNGVPPVRFVGILSQCTAASALSLGVGQIIEVEPGGAELCIRAGSTEEFVVVAHHQTLDSLPTLSVGMAVSGGTTFIGPPLPSLSPMLGMAAAMEQPGETLVPDERFHMRLRQRERTLLPGRTESPSGGAALSLGAPVRQFGTVPQPGDTLTINANANRACDQPVNVRARVAALTQHAVVLHDIENPANGFSDADYLHIGMTFDTLIHPVAVQNFGAPTDIDGNARSFLLYTRKVNELTPANSGSYVGGFFFSRDLFPRTASGGLQGCPASNVMEIFYMLVPDPTGAVNNNVRSRDFVARVTLGTVAHEYQHLINAGRRLHVTRAPTLESVWLDEGLSHMAEELVFYRAAGLAPRSNLTESAILASNRTLTAVNTYLISNLGRLRDHMESPEANSPHRPEDDLARRGAAWYFLRYLADRRGGDESMTWQSLVNSNQRGWDNIVSTIGTSAGPWLNDWAVALFLDDAVAGVPARYQVPSWNMRSVYRNQALGGVLPLATHVFSPGPGPRTVERTLVAGGTLYGRFAVPAAGVATVHTLANGQLPPPSLRLTLVRTR